MTSLVPIGAVIAALRDEFPDVTASKVRYLEAEGLINPQRTTRGSRRYSPADVRDLRRVLRMQRDEFLPLAVIRERLADPGMDAGSAAPGVPASRLRPPRPRRMTSAEICERAQIGPEALRDLVDSGLVVEMDSTAVEVCRAIVRLSAYGIEPRHLRTFRVAADREIGLASQALAPRRGSASSVELREQAAELLALMLDLHVALLRQRSSTLDA